MKVLLISDGTFLAMHAARRLVDLGHVVTDMRSHGSATAPLASDAESLAERVRSEGCDRVLCLIGSRTLVSKEMPSKMMTVLTQATECARINDARFVLASALPRVAAGRDAMRSFEQVVAHEVWHHGLDGGVCRLEGVYGGYAEGSEHHGLIGPMIAAGIAATPLETAAPLDALHWPLHVRDAVDGIVRMLDRRAPSRVRFAGAVPYRTRDVLATVEAVLGVPVSLTTDRLDERRSTHPPQIAEARRLLRWRPRVGLFAGVEEQAFAEATRAGD
jgi:hypothetical protein